MISFGFFEMEELGASEAQKTEMLNYEVLKIQKANDNFFAIFNLKLQF